MNKSVQNDEYGPFKFLDYYEEKDESFFGGREREATDIVANLSRSPTLVVYGRSGTGKTSILYAGVFPILRRKNWNPIYLRLRENPIEDFRHTLLANLNANREPDDNSVDDTSIEGLIKELTAKQPLVLVFDQFEELFIRFGELRSRGGNQKNSKSAAPISQQGSGEGPIQGVSRDVRARSIGTFIELLGRIVEKSGNRLKIIFSLREDYFANMNAFSSAIPRIFDNAYRIEPLTAFGTRQAILKPLSVAGIDFDRQLLSGILDLMSEFGHDAVMLQILCTQVLKRAHERKSDHLRLKVEDLEKLGGVDGIFRTYLSSAIEDLPEELHLTCRMILNAMITHEKTKQAMRLEDFQNNLFVIDQPSLKKTLGIFEEKRLVRRETLDKVDWYELSHERLVPIIQDWIALDSEFIAFMATRDLVRTSCATDVWHKSPNTLLNKGQLTGLVDQFKDRLVFDENEQEFVLHSAIYSGLGELGVFWGKKYGIEETVLLLKNELLVSEFSKMRTGAAKTVGNLPEDVGHKLYDECVKLALYDNESKVWRAACKSLIQIDWESFSDRLVLTSRDEDRRLRLRAEDLLAIALNEGKILENANLFLRFKVRRKNKKEIVFKNARRVAQWAGSGISAGVVGAVAWGFTTNIFVVAILFLIFPQLEILINWLAVFVVGAIVLAAGILIAVLFVGSAAKNMIEIKLISDRWEWRESILYSKSYIATISIFMTILVIFTVFFIISEAGDGGDVVAILLIFAHPVLLWWFMPVLLNIIKISVAPCRSQLSALMASIVVGGSMSITTIIIIAHVSIAILQYFDFENNEAYKVFAAISLFEAFFFSGLITWVAYTLQSNAIREVAAFDDVAADDTEQKQILDYWDEWQDNPPQSIGSSRKWRFGGNNKLQIKPVFVRIGAPALFVIVMFVLYNPIAVSRWGDVTMLTKNITKIQGELPPGLGATGYRMIRSNVPLAVVNVKLVGVSSRRVSTAMFDFYEHHEQRQGPYVINSGLYMIATSRHVTSGFVEIPYEVEITRQVPQDIAVVFENGNLSSLKESDRPLIVKYEVVFNRTTANSNVWVGNVNIPNDMEIPSKFKSFRLNSILYLIKEMESFQFLKPPILTVDFKESNKSNSNESRWLLQPNKNITPLNGDIFGNKRFFARAGNQFDARDLGEMRFKIELDSLLALHENLQIFTATGLAILGTRTSKGFQNNNDQS